MSQVSEFVLVIISDKCSPTSTVSVWRLLLATNQPQIWSSVQKVRKVVAKSGFTRSSSVNVRQISKGIAVSAALKGFAVSITNSTMGNVNGVSARATLSNAIHGLEAALIASTIQLDIGVSIAWKDFTAIRHLVENWAHAFLALVPPLSTRTANIVHCHNLFWAMLLRQAKPMALSALRVNLATTEISAKYVLMDTLAILIPQTLPSPAGHVFVPATLTPLPSEIATERPENAFDVLDIRPGTIVKHV